MGIKLITFTGEHASGGVPRWVRDFKSGIEAESFCWADVAGVVGDGPIPEWERAKILNQWLRITRRVTEDDIIIVDGFWGIGLEELPNVVSCCHGIWSHLIKEEADASKAPDFPIHHAQQVEYRRKHLERGGRLVAVSQFIQHQMEIQWGFASHVINNAIDLEKFKPMRADHGYKRPLIIHGVNDRNNLVKGWPHIHNLIGKVDAEIWSLDEAHKRMWIEPEKYDKYNDTLAAADYALIPSAYEGNSYFALECLACDVPVIAYDVGLFYEIAKRPEGLMSNAGCLLSRKLRSKEETLAGVKLALRKSLLNDTTYWEHVSPRGVAKDYSLQNFHQQWRDYLKREFDYDP